MPCNYIMIQELKPIIERIRLLQDKIVLYSQNPNDSLRLSIIESIENEEKALGLIQNKNESPFSCSCILNIKNLLKEYDNFISK